MNGGRSATGEPRPGKPWLLVSSVPVAVGIAAVACRVLITVDPWLAYYAFLAAMILAAIAAIITSVAAGCRAAPGNRLLASLGWLAAQVAVSAGVATGVFAIYSLTFS